MWIRDAWEWKIISEYLFDIGDKQGHLTIKNQLEIYFKYPTGNDSSGLGELNYECLRVENNCWIFVWYPW